LRGLQAFEAVARAGTLSAAAESIGVTPSAVSHRIRGLETELGVRLLNRSPKGLSLSAAGRKYLGPVADAFALLADGTDDLLGHDESRPLTVSLTSEFGMRWLMPRFTRFRSQHPDIEIALLSTGRIVDLSAGEADIALRYGDGQWPGLKAEPLLEFAISPLCSPAVMAQIEGLTPAEALGKHTWIRETNDDWPLWLDAAGITGVKPAGLLWFADYAMGLSAAIDGQGIVLGYFGYTETEVASGALVQPFDLKVAVPRAYHLVYPEERLNDPRVVAFRDWVMSENQSSDRQMADGG
jgi:LysR family glycine cleavage system transcriptional activator